MAGIGFSLKRLFSKRGFFSLCRAYGYAGIICAGPMILGVIMLAGVSLTARLAGMEAHDRELMNCMLTYSLLVSLSITSWFNMVTTRYVSDMLYEEKLDHAFSLRKLFYYACGRSRSLRSFSLVFRSAPDLSDPVSVVFPHSDRSVDGNGLPDSS